MIKRALSLSIVNNVCQPKSDGTLKFHCDDGGCIWIDYKLNDNEDCGDGSDESKLWQV